MEKNRAFDTKLSRSFAIVKQDMLTLCDELGQIRKSIDDLKKNEIDESSESIESNKKELSELKAEINVLADNLKQLKKENAQIKELSIALVKETEKTNENILGTFGDNIKQLNRETRSIKEELLAIAKNKKYAKTGKTKTGINNSRIKDIMELTPSSISNLNELKSSKEEKKGFFSRIIDYFAED